MVHGDVHGWYMDGTWMVHGFVSLFKVYIC